LLRIIDQAKANRDKAQGDIQTYTQAYNDAVSAQRTAQNDIIAAETRVSQITTAITSLAKTVDDNRNAIDQTGNSNAGLTREKTTLVTTINGLEATKANLLERLKALNAEVAQRVTELSNKTSECQSLTDSVNRKAAELANAQNELTNSNTNRQNAAIEVTRIGGVVDDLRRQLQQAEKELADAKIRLSDIDARRLALPVQISNLRAELDDLQRRAKACADEVTRIQGLINKLKTDDYKGLTDQINDLDGRLTTSRTRVSEIDVLLANSQGPLADLKAKLDQATADLTYVRSQRTEAETNLRVLYQRGNDTNNRVAYAKQNLDAIIKRFQDESKILSDATMNLERARAEESLARLGLEELIAHYSDALPYAIVPNGNGVGSGTPFGNNPSGSALGPATGTGGSFRVNSWTNYLSTAFGAGVNLGWNGVVTDLYPFSFPATSPCPLATAVPVVTTGVVTAVRNDSFDVRSNQGQLYQVNVAPCTVLNANRPDYILEQGATAVVKGWSSSSSSSCSGRVRIQSCAG